MAEDDASIDSPTLDEDDPMRSFLPTAFGKQSKTTNIAAQLNQSKRTVAHETEKKSINRSPNDSSDEGEDEEGDGDDDEEEDEEDEFPTSHEIILKTHERAVTTVTLDPSGSRLVTGSNDCTIKFHDFAAMTPTTLRAFKSVDPTAVKSSAATETHPVHHVAFNPLSAGHLLVVSATPQARVLDRDGDTLTEFVKGDMYLRDMHNTKGHISEITTGIWHPADRKVCVTAGTDSTVRIWDINNKRSQKEVIVHKSRVPGSGGRTRMTAVAWCSPLQGGNNVLISSALDGSLVMWSGNGPYTRPASEIRDAHARDTWTSGLDISADGRIAVTRGGDDTIKSMYDSFIVYVCMAQPFSSLGYPQIQNSHLHNISSIHRWPVSYNQYSFLPQLILYHHRLSDWASAHSQPSNPSGRARHPDHAWISLDHSVMARQDQPDRHGLRQRRNSRPIQPNHLQPWRSANHV